MIPHMRGVLLAWGAGVTAVAVVFAVSSCGSAFTATDVDGGEGGTMDGPGGDRTVDDGPSDVIVLPDTHEEAPPQCTATPGFQCVPEVPLGWNGPFELYVGQQPPPDCSNDPNFVTISFTGHDGFDPGNATCSCTCTPTVTCTAPDLVIYDNGSCDDSGVCATLTLLPGMCLALASGACMPQAVSAGAATASVTCNGELDADIPAPTWTSNVRACASSVDPSRSNCPVGQICQPSPSQAFSGQLCIGVSGDSPNCPQDSPYSVRSVYYEDVSDTRDCSACTCGNPSGFTCSAVFTEFDSCASKNVQTTHNAPFGCDLTQNGNNAVQLALTEDDAGSGSCPPMGGMLQGAAMPTNAATFCCLPSQ